METFIFLCSEFVLMLSFYILSLACIYLTFPLIGSALSFSENCDSNSFIQARALEILNDIVQAVFLLNMLFDFLIKSGGQFLYLLDSLQYISSLFYYYVTLYQNALHCLRQSLVCQLPVFTCKNLQMQSLFDQM